MHKLPVDHILFEIICGVCIIECLILKVTRREINN